MANFKTYYNKLKSFLRECARALKITKKPSKKEFVTVVKVSGLGMLLIGLIGFLVVVLFTLFFKGS